MKTPDRKIFLSVIEGGLLDSRIKKSQKKLEKTFSTPEINYQINLKKLANSYNNFLKI